MAAFNLTAVLQLQAPTNTQQVVSQIQKGLKGVNVKLNVQADTRAVAAVNKQLGGVNKAAQSSSKSINTLNRNLSEAARRFSVITIATGSFIAFARAIKNSIGAAVEFEREMVKISQVTGTSVGQLHGLAKTVDSLSTGLGVANQSLLETSRVLAQAGLSAMKTRQALEVLANTTLAPSFDNIIDTTEGAIAILNQFGRAASKTGQDIKFLEQSLDAINAVSKRFAVESADLITAIRRTGGVFQAAGGNLKELIALFTSVRQTTRESAETIATGFRTIFTRLQRSETIDALDALGISLNDLEGKFVGPMKAIELLSSGLAGLDTRDVRFNEIVEQLGGFRQIGKVIPLLKQMSVTQAALAVANNSSGSAAKDAQLAQQSLAVAFQRVGEQFDSMIRKFSSSDTFRGLADTILSLATSFLKFGKILADVLPQLTALAAIKIGQNLAPGLMSMFGGGGGRRKSMGGRIHGYAKGGWVPGQGSGDTVPAMLTPGEFVIKKSSAQKMGPSALHAMNNNRYNTGDKVTKPRNPRSKIEAAQKIADNPNARRKAPTLTSDAGAVKDSILSVTKGDGSIDVGGAFLQPAESIKQTLNAKGDGETVRQRVWEKIQTQHGKKWTAEQKKTNLADFNQKQPKSGFDFDVNINSGSTSTAAAEEFKAGMNDSIVAAGKTLAPAGMSVNGVKMGSALEGANIEQIEGGIFESWLAGMSDQPFDEVKTKASANDTWDFKQGLGADLGGFFGIDGGIPTDAKRTFGDESVSLIAKKAATDMLSELNIQNTVDEMGIRKTTSVQGKKPIEAAKGGSISGSDTVPALLTPGEFVVQKSAAQSVGYSNLANMNKTGVAKFAKGGAVGVQAFAAGGGVLQQTALSASDPIADIAAQTQLTKKDLAMLGQAAKTNTGAFTDLVGQLQGLDIDAVEAALKNFSRNMTATADAAAVLDGAMDAAHSQVGQMGPSGTPAGPPKSKGVAGQGESRIMPERSGDEMAELSQQADAIAQEFAIMGEETRAGQKAMLAFKQAILAGKTEAEALTAGMDAGQKHVAELDAEMAELLKQFAAGTVSEKKLVAATKKLMKERLLAKPGPGGPSAPPSGGGGGGGVNPFRKMQKGADLMGKKFNTFGKGMGKLSGGLSKAGSALGGLASAALGVMFMMGTLMEQMGQGTEDEKERQQAGMAAITTHIALGAQLLSLGAVVAAATVGMVAKLALDGPALAAKLFGTIADTAEGVASTGAAVADTGEAVATGAVTLALGPFALAILAVVAVLAILLAAVLVIAAVFAGSFLYSLYKSAAAAKGFEQAVRKANEAGDKEKDKLNDPTGASGVASENKFVTARVDAAVADFNKIMIEATKYGRAQREAAEMTGKIMKRSAAAAAGPAYMAASAAMGYFAEQLGYGERELVVLTDAIQDDIDANMRHAIVVAEISKDYATSTYRAIKATNDFTTSMEKAERNNLDATQKMSIMGKATTNMIDTFKANEARVGGNDDKIANLKEQLVAGNVLTRGGEETGRGTGEDSAISDVDRDNLKQLKELEKQKIEYMEANNKLLAETFKKEHEIRANMQESISTFVNEAGENRGRGVGVDLADASLAGNFEAIKNANAEVATAHTDGLKSLKEVISFRYTRLIQAARDTEDQAQIKNLEQQQGLETAIAIKTLERNTLAAAQGVLKMEKASILARVADLQKRKAIMDVNTTLKGFNNMLLGATRTAKLFAQADNAIALASGEAPEAAISDTSILELPFEQIDPKLLNNKLQEAVDMMTAGTDPASLGNLFHIFNPIDKAIRQRANDMKDSITNAGTVIALLPEAMKDLVDPKNLKSLISTTQGKDAADAVFDNINSSMSNVLTGGKTGGMKTQLGTLVHDQIQQLLKDGGTITFEDVQAIQDSIRDLTEEQKAAMIRVIEIKNEYIQKLDSVNTAIISAQQKYADATARVVDVQERAADRMAQATGGRGRRDRGDREQGRRRAASERLGVTARTNGAVAGNVGFTADALASMEADALTAANKAKAGGTKEEMVAANDAAKRLAAGANQARKELERLADQSARASDVMADIKDEQAKRKQLQSLGENLAFGSDEQRKGIAKGFMDLRTALGQGSMRGATDEQRAGIKSTLDSLSDVEIGDTGKTGRELKAGMQADEIMRLTGNKRLAQASFDQAMAGSKEEQLLNELAAIGAQEVAAAQALADNALTQVSLLTEIRDGIENAIDEDINTASGEAIVADKPAKDALDSQIDKLGERLLLVDEGLQKYAESIKKLDDVLKVYRTMLQGLNDAMSVLQAEPRADAMRNQSILKGSWNDPTTGVDESIGLAERHKEGREAMMVQEMQVRKDRNRAGLASGFSEIKMKKFIKDETGKITVNEEGFKQAALNASGTDEIAAVQAAFTAAGQELGAFNAAMGVSATQLQAGAIGERPEVAAIIAQLTENPNTDIDFDGVLAEVDEVIVQSNDAAIDAQNVTMDNAGIVKITGTLVEFKDDNSPTGTSEVTLDAPMVDNKQRGGMVYAANGGGIFQPKGTDTVPAMLTPGEFVIKKSAVDKIGTGELQSMNNGGPVQYRQEGGNIFSGGMADILGNFALDKLKKLKEVGIKKAVSGLLNQEEKEDLGSSSGSGLETTRSDATGAMASPSAFASMDNSQPLASPDQLEQIRKSEAPRLTGAERQIEKASRSSIVNSNDFGGLGDNRGRGEQTFEDEWGDTQRIREAEYGNRSIASTGPELSSRLDDLGEDEFTSINPNDPKPGDAGYGQFFHDRRKKAEAAAKKASQKATEDADKAKKRTAVDAFFAEQAQRQQDLKDLDPKSENDANHKDYHKWPANANKPRSQKNKEAVDEEVKSEYELNGVRHSLYSTGEKWTAAWDAGVDKFVDNYNPYGRLGLSLLMPGGPGIVKAIDALLAANDAVKVARMVKDTIDDPSSSPELVSKLLSIAETKLVNKVMDGVTGPIEYDSSGGEVQYRAGGGSIFQPKGTDTVPAMLTPGEFVIKKSAVDKIGMGKLNAMNNGSPLYRAEGGPVSLPPEGFYTQKIIEGSQDAGIMRSALEEAFAEKGTEYFKALKRLSKRGMIGPENIASSVPFEDFISGLKDSGKQQITDWNPAAPGIVPFDPSIAKWMLQEAQAIVADGGNFTADSERVGGESLKKIEAAKARLTDLSGGIVARTASAPNQDGKVGGELLPFLIFNKMGLTDDDQSNVFTTAGFLSTGVKLAKNLQVSQLDLMGEAAKKFKGSKKGETAGGLGAQILQVAAQQAMAAANAPRDAQQVAGQAGPQAAPQGPRTKVTQETIDGMAGGAVKDSTQIDYDSLMAAGILQMAAGGSVPSQDTVPAMLTPGEFVMSANAVKKHGVGYMKNLNQGRVPGFNKGGIVGRGNVSYLQNGGQPSGGGGVLALDANNVQGVLDEFNTTFGSHIDSLIGQFSTFNESAAGLALAITGGMDVRLSISGDLTTAVKLNGDQAEHVKKALADAVVPMIVEQVSDQIAIKFDELKNSP